MMTRDDIQYASITGATTGVMLWLVLNYLDVPSIGPLPSSWLIIVIPVLWIGGVWLGYFLSRWARFFEQFGKYVAIGFTNAAVDFGVFNFEIAVTGIVNGPFIAVMKAFSFSVAVTHSYFWNKRWAFQSSHQPPVSVLKFLIVNIGGLIINAGITTLFVTLVPLPVGGDGRVWANIGAVLGSASGLIFNFLGFKLIVFKK